MAQHDSHQPDSHHQDSHQHEHHGHGGGMYLRFAAMIVTASILMYVFTYWNTFAWNHIHVSEQRFYMTLTMTAMMSVVMLSFMLKMLTNRAANIGIYIGSAVLFALALWLVRSQTTVQDVSYMKAMIPHHSIAILTSERAEISDPRVRELADEIIAAQRREISIMKTLIDDIENGDEDDHAAATAAASEQTVSASESQQAMRLGDDVPPADADAVAVPAGFTAEVVMTGLTYATSVEFDDGGAMYVAEAGYSYGDASVRPRILRAAPDGSVQTVAQGPSLSGPINDLLWHEGRLYVSHRGKISTIASDGAVRDLVTGLPSAGDHQNNQMTVGPDGKIYFGQGTATNAGVVGLDNFKMGWLPDHRDFHDVPARDIALRKRPFETADPFQTTDEQVTTLPFHPFGSTDSLSVPGQIKANGTILRMNADGSGLEVYASGLRNPYGTMWSPDGTLYATENGFDIRGSRPIANDKEDIYIIEEGGWYGWPDYAMGLPVTDARFKPEQKSQPQFLLQDHPEVVQPWKTFPKHAAIAKVDFSPGAAFGEGRMFVAFFGHMSPMTGKAPAEHGGHRVVRIDPASGQSETFFAPKHHAHGSGQGDGHGHGGQHGSENHSDQQEGGHQDGDGGQHGQQQKGGHHDGGTTAGEQHGASFSAGPRRLLDVRFSPDGEALYIADFGAMTIRGGVVPVPRTGVIWRVVREDAQADRLPTGMRAPE